MNSVPKRGEKLRNTGYLKKKKIEKFRKEKNSNFCNYTNARALALVVKIGLDAVIERVVPDVTSRSLAQRTNGQGQVQRVDRVFAELWPCVEKKKKEKECE